MVNEQMKQMEQQLGAIAGKIDGLRRRLERLQGQLAEFRFESHQEHQELYRSPPDSVCDWVTALPRSLVSRP